MPDNINPAKLPKVKTWQERTNDTTPGAMMMAMEAEIADLRAQLAQQNQSDDFTVDDSELARKIMVFLGRATTESMEPNADPLRDRLAAKIASWRPASQASAQLDRADHEFKNFHRSLCARFGYTHDERDWKRDQVSLEEHIAAQLAQQGQVADAIAKLHAAKSTLDREQGRAAGSHAHVDAANQYQLAVFKLVEVALAAPASAQPADKDALQAISNLRLALSLAQDGVVDADTRDMIDKALAATSGFADATPQPAARVAVPDGWKEWTREAIRLFGSAMKEMYWQGLEDHLKAMQQKGEAMLAASPATLTAPAQPDLRGVIEKRIADYALTIGPPGSDWNDETAHADSLMRELKSILAATVTAPAQPAFPERDLSKPAEQQGLFRKFDVRRVDGSDQPGGKHYGCRYYVLDLNHDQHAPAAMRAYAAACRATHPQLADDIEAEFGASPAAQQAAPNEPGPWNVQGEDDKIDALRLLDVVLTNGVTEYGRTFQQVDWTQVADWRYSAAQQAQASAKDRYLEASADLDAATDNFYGQDSAKGEQE